MLEVNFLLKKCARIIELKVIFYNNLQSGCSSFNDQSDIFKQNAKFYDFSAYISITRSHEVKLILSQL